MYARRCEPRIGTQSTSSPNTIFTVHGNVSQTADAGEFGRTERQALLDPEVARDVDQPERAIGEIDHQQRDVTQVECL